MYNHSDTPNIESRIINSSQIKMTVLRDIDIGEEIFLSYGQEYWEEIKKEKF
jgi:SET domain-containing protein